MYDDVGQHALTKREKKKLKNVDFSCTNQNFLSFFYTFDQRVLTTCAFFGGGSGGIVLLHSSLSSFVASTRLIRSGVGAIDSPDQSRQGFEQYDTSEVLEKVFQSTF